MYDEDIVANLDVSIRRPGFLTGFRAVFSGARFVFGTPSVWPYALVPLAVLCGLTAIFGWLSFALLGPALAQWLPASAGLAAWGVTLLRYLGMLLAASLGVILSLALTPLLSGPALERIVERQERELLVGARAPLGFFAELLCGLRAQASAALFSLPLLGVLFIVDLLFPPAAVVTVPLKFVIAALGLSWNLFDYALTLRGARVRERLELVRRYPAATFGFGVGCSLLFFVPCGAIVLLPIGVAAGTRTVWALLRHDRELLPALPR